MARRSSVVVVEAPRRRSTRRYYPRIRHHRRGRRSGFSSRKLLSWILAIGLPAAGALVAYKYAPQYGAYGVAGGLIGAGIVDYLVDGHRMAEGLMAAGAGLAAANYVASKGWV